MRTWHHGACMWVFLLASPLTNGGSSNHIAAPLDPHHRSIERSAVSVFLRLVLLVCLCSDAFLAAFLPTSEWFSQRNIREVGTQSEYLEREESWFPQDQTPPSRGKETQLRDGNALHASPSWKWATVPFPPAEPLETLVENHGFWSRQSMDQPKHKGRNAREVGDKVSKQPRDKEGD